jgi:TonB family protein
MPRIILRTFMSAALVFGAASVAAPADQAVVQKVKDLYAAAAYEDALAVVAATPEETRVPELDQYRAFCLIALGQKQEAQAAIEALLSDNPLYQPDPAETSPRVVETFTEVKLRVLPSVSRKLYLEAKTALERKNRAAAVEGFETLLQLIATVKEPDENLEDMKVLAEGFLDLSRSMPEAPKPEVPTEVPTNGGTEDAASSTASAPVWTRPVALKQDMPRWNAPDPISRRSEYTGVLRVRVGADGTVQTAEMVRRVHPMYDALLLNAAQSWRYEPAKQDGVAVPADVLVEVRLRPQE